MNSSIEINTNKAAEVIDITSRIAEALSDAKISRGICIIHSLHTTTGLIINEAETGLMQDMIIMLDALLPAGAGYLHDRIDDNAHSHLKAMLTGNSVLVPIDDGRLVLGTWQRILFLEFDGPRRRRVHLQVID
jgi:secondary thiamine-phosphate synthase enzyme